MPSMLCLPLVLCLLGAPASPAPTGAATYSGLQRQTDAAPPRLDATIVVDGSLDEPVWQSASRLTGFSRYSPVDGGPADDSTVVYVWYSRTAMHFGIRAYAAPGTVRATQADRDKIFNDDYISIFLGTYNDGRQATVLSVNPLGVQGDGILVEGGSTAGAFFGGLAVGREAVDQSPNFVFQSAGRVLEDGYVIEVRVPFKSLTYQGADKQTWGLNVTRTVQARGAEYSWAPAARAASSFLRQSGHLTDLEGLDRGLVFDLNPILTSRVTGAPGSVPGRWDYTAQSPQPGLNVRWGITNNLTLNGTVKPDFAEVESDAGQFVFDPRSSLYFVEKRPFFLDGIEQFSTPSNLVYTRRIAAPFSAAKVTGKIGETGVALMSAVDDPLNSVTGTTRPLINVLRVQQDIGAHRIGVLLADKEEGANANRVAGADMRLVFNSATTAQLQFAGSQTVAPGTATRTGMLWNSFLNVSTPSFGARYTFEGRGADFITRTGFISRPAIVHAAMDHRFSLIGGANDFVQKTDFDVVLDGIWQYQTFGFTHGRDAIEKKLHMNFNTRLVGGWHVGASALMERFGFDSALYAPYAIQRTIGGITDTVPFQGRRWIPNLDWLITFDTPQFADWSASAFILWGQDENFYEWASADIGFYQFSANWRPTSRFRAEGSYIWQFYDRPTDGTRVGQGRIPRIKAEYQLTRSIFLRVVGQYTALENDALRNVTGNNEPILIRDSNGVYQATTPFASNRFRVDWLFSYLPTPGTVIYAGYGSQLSDVDAFRFRQLARTQDGFFLKASYLFRL